MSSGLLFAQQDKQITPTLYHYFPTALCIFYGFDIMTPSVV